MISFEMGVVVDMDPLPDRTSPTVRMSLSVTVTSYEGVKLSEILTAEEDSATGTTVVMVYP
jgi:hypothetical protein